MSVEVTRYDISLYKQFYSKSHPDPGFAVSFFFCHRAVLLCPIFTFSTSDFRELYPLMINNYIDYHIIPAIFSVYSEGLKYVWCYV